MPPDTRNFVDPDGRTVPLPEAAIPAALAQGWHEEQDAEAVHRAVQEPTQDFIGAHPVASGLLAGETAALSGATLGASDAVIGAAGGGKVIGQVREAHPYVSGAANIAGAVVDPFGAVGGIAGGASKAAEGALAGEGAGAVRQFGAHVAGAATEGAVIGAGQGVSDLALSDDPLTVDRIASTLSSNALFGAGLGGVAGGAGRLLEKGLGRAKNILTDSAGAGEAASPEVAADLAGLDRKGLAAAETTEKGVIEAGRVPQRQALADDIAGFRSEVKNESKIYLATKGIKEAELPEGLAAGTLKIQEIGKVSFEADKAVDRLLRNPIRLAEKPEFALSALQQQQAALEQLTKREPTLRAMFAADESGTRAAALDQVPAALEKNKALQSRIRELQAEPMSERLQSIRDAQEALKAPKPDMGLGDQMLKGSVQGVVSHTLGTIVPGVGHILGAMAGAKAADAISGLVFGRMAAVTAEQAAKTSAAIDSFLTVGKKLAPIAPVLATKVLSKVAFGPPVHRSQGETTEPHPTHDPDSVRPKSTLDKLYTARSAEIRQQVAMGPDGKAQMRPEAREQMAAKLAPIRAMAPQLADSIETTAARRVQYLADMLPKRPELGGIPTGPDRWHPPELEMRAWARRVAAVEDPAGVETRVAHGQVTPEDIEAYKAVYPERAAAFTQGVIERLPALRKSLPYARKLSLSLLTGVPVDPAHSPNILAVLQGNFPNPNTGQGMAAPKATPQFGSVKKSIDKPTPSQSRSST